MRGPHNIWRLIRTGATFERSGAMRVVLEAVEAPRSIRIAARVLGWPVQWLGLKGDISQPPILRALTALGPAYIKFGQLLSTRPDIVGVELATDLRILQDALPAFDIDISKAEVESELGIKIDEAFESFSEPVAAASLAQVHKAVVRETGQVVAVKVLRPGIERAFRKDVDAFFLAASIIEFIAPFSRRLRPRAVIEHFAGVVDGELDLRMEASAADEFAANTKDDDGFRVPALIWELSSRRVLTTEWVEGVPLGDVEAVLAIKSDHTEFATRILQTFLRHALRDGYFHADMHQGNLMRGPDGDLIALDFGIMGRIDTYTRKVYAEILMGFLKRDYTRVAEAHFEAGYVPADQDVAAFAQALRAVGEPIFDYDASQVSMARLFGHLFDVTERFGMETRTELILLQRTMFVVEGVTRTFDPNLNMWDTSGPVIEKYIIDNLGPKAIARDLAATAKVLARFGPRLPALAEAALINLNKTPESPTKFGSLIWGACGVAVGVAATLLLVD
ncbi:2-polyprenylphenol 6-hydroxylase [Rhodobacterales bacterium 52_120_T64]|nr:2-polyprenylphenol 6-hydroxylase [Rhodobacterales bacterium 52_120_T64]